MLNQMPPLKVTLHLSLLLCLFPLPSFLYFSFLYLSPNLNTSIFLHFIIFSSQSSLLLLSSTPLDIDSCISLPQPERSLQLKAVWGSLVTISQQHVYSILYLYPYSGDRSITPLIYIWCCFKQQTCQGPFGLDNEARKTMVQVLTLRLNGVKIKNNTILMVLQ